MRKKSSNSVRIYYPKFSLEEVIEELKKSTSIIHEGFELDKVVLFGSYARNEYTIASDIDILVIYDESKSDEDRVYKTLMKNIKLPRVELHILSKKEYEKKKGSKWIKKIKEEGIDIL